MLTRVHEASSLGSEFFPRQAVSSLAILPRRQHDRDSWNFGCVRCAILTDSMTECKFSAR
jgi:hypothetical protein